MTALPLPTPSFASMLHEIVPDHCRVDWVPIDPAAVDGLSVRESALVERAVSARRAEFATGRMLLRRLLDTDDEIVRLPNGAPQLPPGRVGSLAHDRGVAVGVVSSTDVVAAIGIDVEPDEPLDRPVADLVVRADDVVPDPLAAFVAKEAVYKTWSCLGGGMLEHHDVRVVFDGSRFEAEVRDGPTIGGRLGRSDGRVVAVAVSPAS